MAPLVLGPRLFASKRAAKAFISSFLQSHTQCTPLTPENLAWALPLFARHPRAKEKLNGFASASVQRNGPHPSFVLTYRDGRIDDISYIKCLFQSSTSTNAPRVYCALREAVAPSVRLYREKAFSMFVVNCEVCETPLENTSNAHVDHNTAIRPFCGLVHDFLEAHGASIDTIGVHSIPYGLGRHHTLTDTRLEEAWVAYHDEKASLRMLCRGCNSANAAEAKRRRTSQ